MDRPRPFYEDHETKIVFIHNQEDDPDGYHVQIGRDHFYLPSRALGDLTGEQTSTREVIGMLSQIDPIIPVCLDANRLNPSDLHIALLKVRLKEQLLELSNAYAEVRRFQRR